MSQWQDRILNHAAFNILEELRAKLDEFVPTTDDSPDVIENIDRLIQVNQYAENTLKGVDPVLIPIQILNGLQQHLGNVNTEVSNFLANRKPAHLTNANNSADQLLEIIARLPTSSKIDRIQEVGKSITSVRNLSEKYIKSLAEEFESSQKQMAEIMAKADEISTTVETQKGRLDTALNEFQTRVDSAENQRQSQFSEAQEKRLTSSTEKLNEQSKEVAARIKKYDEQLNAKIADLQKKSSDFRATTKEQAAGIINVLSDLKKQAQDLVHVIGATGMSGGYQKVANRAWWEGLVWNLVVIASFVGLVLVANSTIKLSGQDVFNWPVFAGKAFLGLALISLIAYGARQVDRAHSSERRNRRYQLELASLGPYLSNLDEAERNQVIIKLAERLFGQEEPQVLGQRDEFSPPLTKVLKIVEDLVKKIPD